MLDKLTEEKNIGNFISKNVFDALIEYWKETIDKVADDFDTITDPKGFNFLPYLNMFLMNRFYDKLFKKPFFNEREMIKNMMMVQQSLYIKMADKFLPKAIEYLESKDVSENHSLMIGNEWFKINCEHKLVFKIYLESKGNFNIYIVNQLKLFAYISTLRVINLASKSSYSNTKLPKL